VRDDKNWALLALAVKMLEPLAVALDFGQTDGRGQGSVQHHMYKLCAHFSSFASPPGPERQQFKYFVLGCFNDRKKYAMRPIHSLAYILYPRYVDQSNQPTAAESSGTFKLLKGLKATRDTRLALSKHSVAEESLLPANCSHATEQAVMLECMALSARRAGSCKWRRLGRSARCTTCWDGG